MTLSERRSPSHRDHDLVDLAASVLAAERGIDDPVGLAALRFGTRVRYRRTALGLSQTEVAERTGSVSQFTLSRIEAGRQFPRIDALYAIAVALDVPPTELLDP